MDDALLLSRYRLEQFLACRRRFQLRFLHSLSWPAGPERRERLEARQAGEQFHRLLERYFLGLGPPPGGSPLSEPLATWWATYRRQGPRLPAGTRLVEYTLTVPISGAFLTGRFDLLVVDGAKAHVFDWKTESEPRDARVLAADLQTRLYLALVTAGSRALPTGGVAINPDELRLTVWYASEPGASVTLGYNLKQHERNWAELEGLVALVQHQVESNEHAWPLTDDLAQCARCAFRLFCGRGDVTPAEAVVDEEWEEMTGALSEAPDAW